MDIGFVKYPGYVDTRIPKKRVLSSSSIIKIQIPNFGDPSLMTDDPEIEIGELDSFSARKQFEVVKRWKPFGSKKEQVLLADRGWDIQFSGGKVDWKTAYLFYVNEVALRGTDNSNIPNNTTKPSDSSDFYVESLYNKPVFAIHHTVIHADGTQETYIYQDVCLLEYNLDSPPDNDQLVEFMSAFAPSRIIGETSSDVEDVIKINSKMKSLMEAIKRTRRS